MGSILSPNEPSDIPGTIQIVTKFTCMHSVNGE